MLKMVAAVSMGSIMGGLSRWWLSHKLNGIFPYLPLGTYLSNMIAGYVMGLACAHFSHQTTLSPEVRLLIMTGFCGGLSTFSTFSLEVVTAFQQGKYGQGIVEIALHLATSLLMTYLGLLTYQWLQYR